MFELNFQSRLPIYEQLYRSVARMAALGVLEKGDPLPSVRALAQKLGVNPNTVQKAYAILERDGLINTVPGKGSFLSGDLSALEKRRELAAGKLRDAAEAALECGMTKEEILSAAADVCDKGGSVK
jgi:GntR family transcriptional regulator